MGGTEPPAKVLVWNAQLDGGSGGCEEFLKADHPGLEESCCEAQLLLPDAEMLAGYIIPWMLVLFWVFSGVALGAEVFMTSIEVITSKEKVRNVVIDGKAKKFHTRVWNPTVANLTLMALGSSAPEILLSIVEILKENFHAGELGPSTIVGSAAFNLMVITAVCLICLPEGEVRRIEQLSVFLTTSFYSVMAYVWVLIIVVVWTPEVITVTEGVLTIVFLVLLIIQAYMTDRYFTKSKLAQEYVTVVTDAGEVVDPEFAAKTLDDARTSGIVEPGTDTGRLASFLKPQSRAHYRRNVIKSMKSPRAPSTSVTSEADHAQAMADISKATAESMKATFSFRDPKADPEPDPEAAAAAPSPKATSTRFSRRSSSKSSPGLGEKSVTRVRPDAASVNGVICFKDEVVSVLESVGSVTLHVERRGGSEGEVQVAYTTKEQTATADADYVSQSGTLTFAPGEVEKQITIEIIDDDMYEKDEEFTVVLTEPTGGAVFDHKTDGESNAAICTVIIVNDDEATGKLGEVLAYVNMLNLDNLRLARANWGTQLREAVDIGEGASLFECILFVLMVPWRLLFALVPPPALWGGWPCFAASLMGIGFQVVLINDFASQMGCQMYIKKPVTAITFVALGTSLPDTFASMQAAREDKSADNSIGNVTGSNSVNVFFGLGLPWAMAAIYWKLVGADDEWKARYPTFVDEYPNGAFVVYSADLGFSVVVFTCCAITTLSVILVRRYWGDPPGELGGNRRHAFMHAGFLVSLWLLYITLSVLSTEKMITTF